MMAHNAAGDNDAIQVPHRLKDHLFIEQRPNVDVGSDALVPAPLHVTLWGTGGLLQTWITLAAARGGEVAGLAEALDMGIYLLEDAPVRPVPYHWGAFEGRFCHLIGAQGHIFREALAPFELAEILLALR